MQSPFSLVVEHPLRKGKVARSTRVVGNDSLYFSTIVPPSIGRVIMTNTSGTIVSIFFQKSIHNLGDFCDSNRI